MNKSLWQKVLEDCSKLENENKSHNVVIEISKLIDKS